MLKVRKATLVPKVPRELPVRPDQPDPRERLGQPEPPGHKEQSGHKARRGMLDQRVRRAQQAHQQSVLIPVTRRHLERTT